MEEVERLASPSARAVYDRIGAPTCSACDGWCDLDRVVMNSAIELESLDDDDVRSNEDHADFEDVDSESEDDKDDADSTVLGLVLPLQTRPLREWLHGDGFEPFMESDFNSDSNETIGYESDHTVCYEMDCDVEAVSLPFLE